jgi:hypothetical protein
VEVDLAPGSLFMVVLYSSQNAVIDACFSR